MIEDIGSHLFVLIAGKWLASETDDAAVAIVPGISLVICIISY